MPRLMLIATSFLLLLISTSAARSQDIRKDFAKQQQSQIKAATTCKAFQSKAQFLTREPPFNTYYLLENGLDNPGNVYRASLFTDGFGGPSKEGSCEIVSAGKTGSATVVWRRGAESRAVQYAVENEMLILYSKACNTNSCTTSKMKVSEPKPKGRIPTPADETICSLSPMGYKECLENRTK
jgi:hypothetical protein